MSWARELLHHIKNFGVAPPRDLMTDGGTGPNRRIRVDTGQTSFFAGREFRTFKELSVSNGQTYVVKITAPINFILQELTAEIESGTLKITTWIGGTEGGSFSDTLPRIGTNQMTERPFPFYTSKLTVVGGGTHTGGTQVRVTRLRASGGSVETPVVAGLNSDAQGLPANTYYVHFESTAGTVTGVAQARWEERP